MTVPDRGIGLAGHVGLLNDRIRALGNVFILSSLPAQRIIRQFREAGALTPATATRFHASSIAEQIAFGSLLRGEYPPRTGSGSLLPGPVVDLMEVWT